MKHGADVNAVAEKLVKEKRGFYVKTCYYQLVNVCEYFIKVVDPPKFNVTKKKKKKKKKKKFSTSDSSVLIIFLIVVCVWS